MEQVVDANVFYQKAVTADSFQDLVDLAQEVLKKPVILADSIHNLLAVSRDVTARFGAAVTWQQLMDAQWLPCPPRNAEGNYHLPLESQLKMPQTIRLDRCVMENGSVTYLCDIREKQHIVLKLAVIGLENVRMEAQIQSLAESCYLLYFKLVRMKSGMISGRGQYLSSLLEGNPQNKRMNPQWLGVEPPYALVVFPTADAGVVALSFSQMAIALEREFGYGIRTVTPKEQLIFLMHVPHGYDHFIKMADGILSQNSQPAGVSLPFYELENVRDRLIQANRQLQAAMDFQGFCRCATAEEFIPFELFQMAAEQDTGENLLHQDAKILWETDKKRASHYLETVFSWLYYEKNASRAAQHIFVHRNTLDNRMGKITEQLKSRWDNGGYCTRMLYSTWLLLRRQGWLRDSMLHLTQ